jgi:serine/threonine protein kinase
MPPSTFAPGHHLVGRYRIQALLGVGQTAEVYVAQDLSLQRTVVVKVLLPRLAEHEEVRRAFRDRIVRAATLSHPHLARVFDGGQESGAIFMITEYLNGGTLDDVLATGRTLSVDDGARLGRDVANALAYVHANGVVHGSLSPSKLLFDDEGRVRVSDVALAGLGDAYRERFTLDDVRYLSPEQAIGDPPDGQSDVYALALIIFEAVTGTTAFDGLTPEAVLRARINSSLPVRPELGTLDMLLAQAAVPDARLRLDAEQFSSRLSTTPALIYALDTTHVDWFSPTVTRPDHGRHVGGHGGGVSRVRPGPRASGQRRGTNGLSDREEPSTNRSAWTRAD